VGNLLVRISPDRANTRIQGPNGFQRTVQGDMDLNGLEIGPYTLYAQLSGFQDQQIVVQVHPNRSTQVTFSLVANTVPVPPGPAPQPVPPIPPQSPFPQNPVPQNPIPPNAPQPVPGSTRSSPVLIWGGLVAGLAMFGLAAYSALAAGLVPNVPTIAAYMVMLLAFALLWPQIAAQVRWPSRTLPAPQPQPQTRASRGPVWLYCLLAMLAIGYLLYGLRPAGLMEALKPVDDWFYLNFFSGLPEFYDWLRAGLYAGLGVGLFWLLVYLLTRWAWFWPPLVIAALTFALFFRTGGPVGGATLAVIAAAAVGVLYLMLGMIERYAPLLAVGLGAVVAAIWANGAQVMETSELATGGVLVAAVVWCAGQIVRLTRKR
jgi:hypothetical protein